MTDQAKKTYVIKDPIRRALTHSRAAVACAPYVSPSRLPGLIEFEASLPEMVHEAEYHLEQANRRPKQLGYYEEAWNKYSRGNALRQHPQARLSCSYEMKTWDVPRYAVAVHDFPLVPDAMRIAVDLASERRRRKEKLRGFELSCTLGLIDRNFEELARGAMPADSEELQELAALASSLAPAAYKAFRAIKGSETTRDEAALLAARLAAIAIAGRYRKRELFVRQKQVSAQQSTDHKAETVQQPETSLNLTMRLLWWRQINKLNNFVVAALKRDEALARRIPPQWFAAYADSIASKDPASALRYYALGRRTWRSIRRDCQPLWVHALGLAGPGSPEELEIHAQLAALQRDRFHDFARFLRQVGGIEREHPLWRAGRDKILLLGVV